MSLLVVFADSLINTVLTVTYCFTSGSSLATLFEFSGRFGHSSSNFQKKSGPLIQLLTLESASNHNLLEASSAVLDSVFTYRHPDGSQPSRITAIRLATKVWYLVVSLSMYLSTGMLSVQTILWLIGISNSFSVIFLNKKFRYKRTSPSHI